MIFIFIGVVLLLIFIMTIHLVFIEGNVAPDEGAFVAVIGLIFAITGIYCLQRAYKNHNDKIKEETKVINTSYNLVGEPQCTRGIYHYEYTTTFTMEKDGVYEVGIMEDKPINFLSVSDNNFVVKSSKTITRNSGKEEEIITYRLGVSQDIYYKLKECR